jgi:hypothetical protein
MARAPLAQPWLTHPEPPFWRGSGCALPVMAAAQIRRFCLPANPAELPSFPLVPHAGAASLTSPARLTSGDSSASETRNDPVW